MKESTCRGCGEPIIWTKTPRGKNMPVDVEPVRLADKQLGFMLREEGSTVYADPVKGERYGGPAHVAHWTTCPNADDFHKKR